MIFKLNFRKYRNETEKFTSVIIPMMLVKLSYLCCNLLSEKKNITIMHNIYGINFSSGGFKLHQNNFVQ